jgi:hypothetical protein
MANRMNRYKAMAANIQRHDTACTIPRHVFLRAQNANGNRVDRKGDR